MTTKHWSQLSHVEVRDLFRSQAWRSELPHRLKPIAGADNQALALNQFGSRVGCLGTGVTDGAEVIVFDRPMADLNSALWSRQVPGLLLTDNTDVGSVYPVRLRRVLKFVTAIKPSFKHIVSDA